MKKQSILFLLLITNFVFSQQSAKVHYKVETDWKLYDSLHSNLNYRNQSKILLKKVLNIAQDLDFYLKFNTNESLYYCEDIMPDETFDMRLYTLAKTLGRGYAKHYQNKKENISLHQFIDFSNKKLYREYEKLFINNWKITKETDTILGYPVIKAIRGVKEIAWFTPNIPVPFGPGGQGGLPGLILKYKYNFTGIVVTQIFLYKKPLKIKKPKKGILRTVEEGRVARIKSINR